MARAKPVCLQRLGVPSGLGSCMVKSIASWCRRVNDQQPATTSSFRHHPLHIHIEIDIPRHRQATLRPPSLRPCGLFQAPSFSSLPLHSVSVLPFCTSGYSSTLLPFLSVLGATTSGLPVLTVSCGTVGMGQRGPLSDRIEIPYRHFFRPWWRRTHRPPGFSSFELDYFVS